MALNPYHPGEWQQSTTPGGPGAPTPAVVTWFKVYCGVLAVLYLLFAGMGVIYFVIPAEEMEMAEAEAKIVGSVFIGMGGLFFVASILPFFCAPQAVGLGLRPRFDRARHDQRVFHSGLHSFADLLAEAGSQTVFWEARVKRTFR